MAASSQTKSLKTSHEAGSNFGTFERYAAMFLRRQLFRILYYLTDRLGSFYSMEWRGKNNHPVEGISRFTAKGGLLP
ncbi:hypothetical protein [Azospirillum sp. B2RO_4]|uniref:hypothetical protein n=1 Tax=Azospirillum sp. B2RO_4 TaxID=3027796 RepID=UPI003DA9F073